MVKYFLDGFETIGHIYAKILKDQLNITTIDELTAIPLEYIVDKTNIEEERIEQWLEIADLLRIPTMSIKNAELLLFAKINSVTELSHRQSIRILYKFQNLDKNTYHIIIKQPSLHQIESWINYAKLMTQRIKSGDNIPLVCFPMITLDHSSNFQKHQIVTLRDLKEFPHLDLQKNIGLSENKLKEFIQLRKLLDIDGIDIYIGNLLLQANITSTKQIIEMNENDLLIRVQSIQVNEMNPLEILSMEKIKEIKAQTVIQKGGTN
ncbi:DUF4332 domain-containing protein [Candidatus Lokiarchaeum ossiferum]|uniref:DUF4332 domain-containing protein n=1 Tax=Candidatus Lokiarchaeum ossiferum TaxID=2951803 RepID=UPI00352C571B